MQNRKSRIILASASPRRRELLRELVSEFEVVPPDLDESQVHADPWNTAKGLALRKGEAIQRLHPDSLIISADTVVAFQNLLGGWDQLAKPVDSADAIRMLELLSGRRHVVITAVSVTTVDTASLIAETTKVTFRRLSNQEIESYVATGEPMDKAGAYAIQGGAKGFVESIEGSLSNVIGLPLEALSPILERALTS
ncbi:MAG: Maf family protein [Fimbriimonadales bacterium]